MDADGPSTASTRLVGRVLDSGVPRVLDKQCNSVFAVYTASKYCPSLLVSLYGIAVDISGACMRDASPLRP